MTKSFDTEDLSNFQLQILKAEEPKLEKKELIEGKAFVLENLLSEEECKYYINESEKAGYLKMGTKYRTNDRVVIKSAELAEVLFERIKPFLPPTIIVTPSNSAEFSNHEASSVSSVFFTSSRKFEEGEWRLKGLNEGWRFCRYDKGGFFKAHIDGSLILSSTEKSFITLNIYLNDTIGGHTNFLRDHYQSLEEREVVASVHPKAGSALIFYHPILHEGDVLEDGVKYLLRSDVMYERVSELDDNMGLAYSLIQQAERAESDGKNNEAVQLYRRAFKLCPELEKEV